MANNREPTPEITAADVVRAGMRETVHGHGKNGLYFYRWVCIQYPRLTKEVRRESRRVGEVTTFRVDGMNVAGTAGAIATALNRPHDTTKIADRFNAQRVNGVAVFVDGRLAVRGETLERCMRLRESYPHFEGVPIDWIASVPEGE